jgi:predicted metal-dependent hydrolase
LTKLKKLFHEFNARYFRNSLPRNTIVVYADLTKKRALGHCGERIEERKKLFNGKSKWVVVKRTPIIRIDNRLKFSTVLTAMTLAHEMCHLSLNRKHPRHKHGPLFNKEMKRLAARGAFNPYW